MSYTLFIIVLSVLFVSAYFFKYSGQINILPEEAFNWNAFQAKFYFADKSYIVPAEVKKLLIHSGNRNLYGKPTISSYKRVKLKIARNPKLSDYYRVILFCEGNEITTFNLEKSIWKELFGWRRNFTLYMSL
jgi:hypothetical protein